jgi:hypothetical protein
MALNSSCGANAWKFHRNFGAGSSSRFDLECAASLLDHLLRKPQSKSMTVRFGRKSALRDSRKDSRRYPFTVVLDRYVYVTVPGVHYDVNFARVMNGIDGIID